MRSSNTTEPAMLRICAALALLGCVALIGGNVVGSLVVPDHDWVADTVSDLAAGEWEIIQDVALYGYAGGLLALALGCANAHPGGLWWSASVFGLAVLALLVTVIGARNEYGDGDNEGIVIHLYLVIGLGMLFTLVPLGLQGPIGERSAMRRIVLLACTAAWAVGAGAGSADRGHDRGDRPASRRAWARGGGLIRPRSPRDLPDRSRARPPTKENVHFTPIRVTFSAERG
ncbi:DUF998 domain-containing protein [Pontivivens ytuae]|uniref:DUF998 domain-containing protein n=1 Tax=Pontivivens ytuae TaxID=2789856 RepID=UPI001E52D77F|nr:DUF998 domain-containing protein [Pontivivens ytuae]